MAHGMYSSPREASRVRVVWEGTGVCLHGFWALTEESLTLAGCPVCTVGSGPHLHGSFLDGVGMDGPP